MNALLAPERGWSWILAVAILSASVWIGRYDGHMLAFTAGFFFGVSLAISFVYMLAVSLRSRSSRSPPLGGCPRSAPVVPAARAITPRLLPFPPRRRGSRLTRFASTGRGTLPRRTAWRTAGCDVRRRGAWRAGRPGCAKRFRGMERGAAPVQFRQRGAAPLKLRLTTHVEVGLSMWFGMEVLGMMLRSPL
jgi:hypothetical protein